MLFRLQAGRSQSCETSACLFIRRYSFRSLAAYCLGLFSKTVTGQFQRMPSFFDLPCLPAHPEVSVYWECRGQG